MLNKEQIDKVGNTIIFLTEGKGMYRTILLKLIYILDEFSIKKTGIPFFNFEYKVWKYGPVEVEVNNELSDVHLLEEYIKIEEGKIYPVKDFSDDEFTDNDLELLKHIKSELRNSNSEVLINYTHRENSPWYNSAKEHGVLDLLLKEYRSTTDFDVNMEELITHDSEKLKIYRDYQEIF